MFDVENHALHWSHSAHPAKQIHLKNVTGIRITAKIKNWKNNYEKRWITVSTELRLVVLWFFTHY